jgi:hypothetical protein
MVGEPRGILDVVLRLLALDALRKFVPRLLGIGELERRREIPVGARLLTTGARIRERA